jgi:hypothetical protein
MKRILTTLLTLTILSVIGFAATAHADPIYQRDVVTIATTPGTATWTNTNAYASLELQRIWIERSLVATDTQTVKRVTSDGVYTQAVGTVAIATSMGNTASLTASFLKYGDKLTFTGTAATGSVAIVEYKLSR